MIISKSELDVLLNCTLSSKLICYNVSNKLLQHKVFQEQIIHRKMKNENVIKMQMQKGMMQPLHSKHLQKT